MYQSTKTIDGFSTVFRQWRADSHCSKLHGYALKFKVIFQSNDLDSNNWVMDFGFLKSRDFTFDGMYLGDWFKSMFDHTTIIASDDPQRTLIQSLSRVNVINLKIVDRVGCEAFSELVYLVLKKMCDRTEHGVKVLSVECIENEKNSAIYYGDGK